MQRRPGKRLEGRGLQVLHLVPGSERREHYRGNNHRPSPESNTAQEKSALPARRKLFTKFEWDTWLQRHLLAEVSRGPGLRCLTLWSGIALSVAALQVTFFGKLSEGAEYFLAVANLCGVAAVIADIRECRRLHHLILLRRVARRCLRRMDCLRIESEKIVEFVHWLSADPEVQQHFRSGPCRSIRLVVQTLDRLNATAEHYGCVGKYVFKANEEPIVRSVRMLRSMPVALEDLLSGTLCAWLEEVPRYDPEGWSLAVAGKLIRLP